MCSSATSLMPLYNALSNEHLLWEIKEIFSSLERQCCKERICGNLYWRSEGWMALQRACVILCFGNIYFPGKLQSTRIKAMSRRPVNPIARRFAESAVTPSSSPSHQKARSSPLLSLGLVILGAFLLLGYSYSGSGSTNKGYSREDRTREALSNEEDISCGSEVIKALPILREVYGESAHKVLHVGPESCAVTSRLLKDEDTEAWGIDPFDIIPPLDNSCKSMIRKGIVRVADIKFPLPYKAQSFSIVLVSDAPDSLSPKYLNKTLPDLARVSIDGLVMFVGQPGHRSSTKTAQIIQQSVGRPPKLRGKAWWQRSFEAMGLQENESMSKKFEELKMKRSYNFNCQIFHLSSDLSP